MFTLMLYHLHKLSSILHFMAQTKREAQLSQRSRAMLRIIEYFANSLKVTQGHSKWHFHERTCKSLLVFHCSYVPISYRFWDIQRQIMVWPWNTGKGSFKVIGNGTTDRSHTSSYWRCVVTIALSCIISEIMQDNGRKLQFYIPLHSISPFGDPRQNIVTRFGTEKLEWCGYPTLKKMRKCLLVSTQYTNMTDRRTDTARQHRRRLCIASRGKRSCQVVQESAKVCNTVQGENVVGDGTIDQPEDESRVLSAEMNWLRWIRGISRRDKISNDVIRRHLPQEHTSTW